MKVQVFTGVLVGALLGCSNPVEPEGPGDGEPTAKYYEVQVNLWRIDVIEDCDANILLIPNPGDFAYAVDVEYENEEGEKVADEWVVASTLYGNPREGEILHRGAGETIEFSEEHGNDVSSIFTVREGTEYKIRFHVIEWDGNSEDARLNGTTITKTILVNADGVGVDMKAPDSSDASVTGDCSVSLRGSTLHREVELDLSSRSGARDPSVG